MKFLSFIALPLLLLPSCANLAEDRWDEKEDKKEAADPAPEPENPIDAPEPPSEEPDDALKLVDPVTTSELMKDENKKTVSGPAPVNVPEPETDSAIEIKPTIPAPAED